MFGNRWGYIDRTGNLLTESRFIATFAFCEGLAAVVVPQSKGEPKAGYIDGKAILPFQPTSMTPRYFPKGSQR